MSNPRRECIFCDSPVDSKEHIWSGWMHDLLGGKPDAKYNRHTTTRWADGRKETTGPTGKPGNIFNIQVRSVCGDCNSGWMNRAEGVVKSFLAKMIAGDPVTIDSEQMSALARWCAHKFIVMEHAAAGTSVTPRCDRVALKDRGVIPPYFRIYIGNHASKHRFGSTRHSHSMVRSLADGPVPPLDGTTRNIQTVTILMGRLFIHLNAARIDGFEIETTHFISRVWDECRIWPNPNSSLVWPHRPFLDDAGLSMVSNTLETIFSAGDATGKITWLDSLPGG